MCCQTQVHVPDIEADEAKQTKTLEFGAEKSLLQGQARRMGISCSKELNSQMGFREVFLKANFGVGLQVCNFLLIGWW